MTVRLRPRTVTVLALAVGAALVLVAGFAAVDAAWTLATAALGLLQLLVLAMVLLVGRRPAPAPRPAPTPPAGAPAAVDPVGARVEVLCTRLLAEVARHRSELRDLREEVAGLAPVTPPSRRDPAS